MIELLVFILKGYAMAACLLAGIVFLVGVGIGFIRGR